MTDVLLIVLPVFGLIGLGMALAAAKVVPDTMGDALGRFAFVAALPAFLFRTLSTASLPAEVPWGYWIAYFAALLVVWGLGQGMARLIFRTGPREAVLVGLAVAQANTVMVGIPLILKAYGEAAAVPIALLLALNLPITMTLATILVESQEGRGLRQGAGRLARGLATHPILVAIFAGVIYGRFGVGIAAPIDGALKMLGDTAIPCALVGLGITLLRYGLGGRGALVAATCALKLLVMPAIVYVLAKIVLGLPPLYVGAAVIFASAPVGVNVYIFATRYRTAEGFASGAIAASTVASVATSTFWLWLVGLG